MGSAPAQYTKMSRFVLLKSAAGAAVKRRLRLSLDSTNKKSAPGPFLKWRLRLRNTGKMLNFFHLPSFLFSFQFITGKLFKKKKLRFHQFIHQFITSKMFRYFLYYGHLNLMFALLSRFWSLPKCFLFRILWAIFIFHLFPKLWQLPSFSFWVLPKS